MPDGFDDRQIQVFKLTGLVIKSKAPRFMVTRIYHIAICRNNNSLLKSDLSGLLSRVSPSISGIDITQYQIQISDSDFIQGAEPFIAKKNSYCWSRICFRNLVLSEPLNGFVIYYENFSSFKRFKFCFQEVKVERFVRKSLHPDYRNNDAFHRPHKLL
jgi:hypothetical protein